MYFTQVAGLFIAALIFFLAGLVSGTVSRKNKEQQIQQRNYPQSGIYISPKHIISFNFTKPEHSWFEVQEHNGTLSFEDIHIEGSDTLSNIWVEANTEIKFNGHLPKGVTLHGTWLPGKSQSNTMPDIKSERRFGE